MAGFHRKLLAVRPFASKRLLKMGTNRWLVRGTRARRGPFTLPQVTGNILAFCAGVNDFLPGAASPTVRYGISSSLDERRSIERTTAKNRLGTVAHPFIYCASFIAALPLFRYRKPPLLAVATSADLRAWRTPDRLANSRAPIALVCIRSPRCRVLPRAPIDFPLLLS